MNPIEIAAKAIRNEFIDKIIDKANPHWGEQKPDYLLNACKEAGYPEPDKAADFFANAAARAALLALAEVDFKGPHLLPDEAFKARLRSIANEVDQ